MEESCISELYKQKDMKQTLDELTLHDFIELSCGNKSVLLQSHEKIDDKVLSAKERELLIEYQQIADQKRARIFMLNAEDANKLRMKSLCLRICLALHGASMYEDVRCILKELEVENTDRIGDAELITKIRNILNENEFEIQRIEEVNESGKRASSPKEIKASFHKEIAFLITFFKMNIDMSINAAIYANLVRQCNEQINSKRI